MEIIVTKSVIWNGDNLKKVIALTGLYEDGFEKWFHNSWEEYEKYVHDHNDIFKLFYPDGTHIEVPKGSKLVKYPNGRIEVREAGNV